VLLTLVAVLATGCSFNPLTETQITITIEAEHPWRSVMHKPLWHTLSYTHGGVIEHLHLDGGSRSATLAVPRDRLTVLCAYPLSSLHPWGGFYQPGGERSIILTQEMGYLASLLLDAYTHNPEAVEMVGITALITLVGDGTLVDAHQLLLGIFNGTLKSEPPTVLEPITVRLADLPEGLWVSELISGSSFHLLWGEEAYLRTGAQMQRWLNKERGLTLSVSTDLVGGRYTTAVTAAPKW
jgi:hypothetical protein